jgi:hypothetical protein
MRRDGRVYYENDVEDAKKLYIKELSFYLDILNYLLCNYDEKLTFKEKEILKENINKVNRLLVILKNSIIAEEIDKDKIDYIMHIFNKIVSNTENIEFKIFKSELTDVNKYQKGENFNFLVHAVTNGYNRLEKNSSITSTSLISEDNIGLFINEDNVNSYGYIFDIDLDNIVVSSNADIFSDIKVEYDNIEFSDIFEKYYSYNDFEVKISPIFSHGIASISKIIPISYMKKINTDECIKVNGEKLNYDVEEIYNEIVLLNNLSLVKKAVFVRTNGDKSISVDYKEAKKLAEKHNLPLIEIDLSLYREKNNLDILTKKDEKKILRRFLEIVNEDKEIYKLYLKYSKVSFDKKCLDMYMDLRDKEYLNKEELKEYLISSLEKEKSDIKVKKLI